MGYYANGSGNIVMRSSGENTDLDEVKSILKTTSLEFDVYESCTPPEISIWQDSKYYEQEILDAFNEMKQYVSDIYIKFIGEDSQMWEIFLEKGEIKIEELVPVSAPEYSLLLRCKEYLCKYINATAQETNGSDALRAAKSLGIRNKDLEELGFDWLLDLQDSPPSVNPEGNGVEDDDNDDDTVSMSEDLFNFLIGGGFII